MDICRKAARHWWTTYTQPMAFRRSFRNQPTLCRVARSSCLRLYILRSLRIIRSFHSSVNIENRFQYNPLVISNAPELNQIRVLTVLPGAFHDPISCELNTVNIADAEYEAISYVWGNPDITEAIQLNGYNFDVTTSLECALRYLRLLDTERYIWADAICINQDDLDERYHQVQLMGRIYKQADRVLVWLGEPNADIEIAFDTAKRMNEILNMAEQTRNDTDQGEVVPQGPTQIGGDLLSYFKITDRELHSLKTVFTLYPWWTRVWCVQEFALAREAVFVGGHRKMSWHDIPSFPRINDIGFHKSVGLSPVLRSWGTLQALRNDVQFNVDNVTSYRDLLRMYSQPRECSDPRDKLYALLSLSKFAQSKLQPDYGRSLSSVCLDATRLIIEESGNLEIACCYDYHEEKHRGFLTSSQAIARYRQLREGIIEPLIQVLAADNPERVQELRQHDIYRVIKALKIKDIFRLMIDIGGNPEKLQKGLQHNDVLEINSLKHQFVYDDDNQTFVPGKDSYLRKEDEIIPSWVPNLTRPPNAPFAELLGMPHFNASKHTKAGADTLCSIPWLLHLRTIEFDTIREQSPIITLGQIGWKSVIREWKSKIYNIAEYPTGEAAARVFWRTVLARVDRPPEYKLGLSVTSQVDQYANILSAWLELPEGDVFEPKGQYDHNRSNNPKIEGIINGLKSYLDRTRFFVSANGHFGVVSGSTEPGDSLHIVQGASVPMVLRQRKEYRELVRGRGISLTGDMKDADFYTKAGSTYIHGVMKGEIVRDMNMKGLMWQRTLLV